VLVDEADQEQWEAPGLRRVHGEVLAWETDADSALVQGRHEGYLASLGIVCSRTVYLQAGRFFLVHDLVDASQAAEGHMARWSIQCPDPMVEEGKRACVASGLMRIAPAWPESIERIEMTNEGKAVWPEADEEGRMDVHRRLHQVRWCSPVPAGGRAEFLMLIQPDEEPYRLGQVEAADGQLLVEVRSQGSAHEVLLSLPS
jgi:hypothetical protein